VTLVLAGHSIKRGIQDVPLALIMMLDQMLKQSLFVEQVDDPPRQIGRLVLKLPQGLFESIQEEQHLFMFTREEFDGATRYSTGPLVNRQEQLFLLPHVTQELALELLKAFERERSIEHQEGLLMRKKELIQTLVRLKQGEEAQ
jgi:hypothetical protein